MEYESNSAKSGVKICCSLLHLISLIHWNGFLISTLNIRVYTKTWNSKTKQLNEKGKMSKKNNSKG